LTANIYDNISGEVVGVVEPVRLVGPRTLPRPALFLSARRFTSSQRDIVIRAGAESASLAPLVRSVVASLDRTLPVYMIAEMHDLVDAALARDRSVTIVMAAFGTAAWLLAAIGVFGLCSADVSLRRREIGVRMALGSTAAGLIVMLLGRALRRVSVGIAVGAVLALATGRAMSAILFGVSPFDPVSFAVIVVVALTIAAAATVLPGVRALRRQPLSVLREN
jgi:ABC-type antimicrobial peptide transport system permease subunit